MTVLWDQKPWLLILASTLLPWPPPTARNIFIFSSPWRAREEKTQRDDVSTISRCYCDSDVWTSSSCKLKSDLIHLLSCKTALLAAIKAQRRLKLSKDAFSWFRSVNRKWNTVMGLSAAHQTPRQARHLLPTWLFSLRRLKAKGLYRRSGMGANVLTLEIGLGSLREMGVDQESD